MTENDKSKGYTLVLDLDETLVHYNPSRKSYLIRPGCLEFLEELSLIYEIVIFTASVSKLANLILNKLDPQGNRIRHRLFREHCLRTDYAAIKDLSKLGRPLERTIIIDNIERNFER